MSALLQLKTMIEASLDDDASLVNDPAGLARRMLDEARKIGRMALEVSDEIARDRTIGAAEAARQAAMVAEETANAAARLQARLEIVRSLPAAG